MPIYGLLFLCQAIKGPYWKIFSRIDLKNENLIVIFLWLYLTAHVSDIWLVRNNWLINDWILIVDTFDKQFWDLICKQNILVEIREWKPDVCKGFSPGRRVC